MTSAGGIFFILSSRPVSQDDNSLNLFFILILLILYSHFIYSSISATLLSYYCNFILFSQLFYFGALFSYFHDFVLYHYDFILKTIILVFPSHYSVIVLVSLLFKQFLFFCCYFFYCHKTARAETSGVMSSSVFPTQRSSQAV